MKCEAHTNRYSTSRMAGRCQRTATWTVGLSDRGVAYTQDLCTYHAKRVDADGITITYSRPKEATR